MRKCNMVLGSIDSIETFGLVDGPGIRTVVFLNGCSLRCKYCHNPEMWNIRNKDTSPSSLVEKLIRFKPYYKRNNGGVTFSGGEPLLQVDYIIEVAKLLKKENIHIALDTAGVGIGKYEEILNLVDLVILDIKHLTDEEYKNLVGRDISEFNKFIKICQNLNKPLWIRQVIVPGIHDNDEYMKIFKDYVNKLDNVDNIDFIPYHKLGSEKYESLGINNPYKEKKEMNVEECQRLYQKYIENKKVL